MPPTARSVIASASQTASATVSEMMETHGMLRNDTTALFERLRWERNEGPMLSRLVALNPGKEAQLRSIATTYLQGLTNQVEAMDKAAEEELTNAVVAFKKGFA